MESQDDKRRIRGEDPSTRQEMIAIAREVEMNIIAHEAEMRKCKETPPARSTKPCTNEARDHVAVEVGGDARTKRPIADRLGERVLPKDRDRAELENPPHLIREDATDARRRDTLPGTAPTQGRWSRSSQPRRKSTCWQDTEQKMWSSLAAKRRATQ